MAYFIVFNSVLMTDVIETLSEIPEKIKYFSQGVYIYTVGRIYPVPGVSFQLCLITNDTP